MDLGALKRLAGGGPLSPVRPRAKRRPLRALARATDGIALVETAMVAPFLAVIIMGTIDVARYGAARLAVQQSVNRGLEMSMMGGPTLATSDIQTQSAEQAGVATSAVTVTQSLECSGTVTNWSGSCSTGQETARYTQIQISTTFTPTFVFGAMARMFGSQSGLIPVDVTGVIRIQ